MTSTHNFDIVWKEYLIKRNISESIIQKVESKKLISYEKDNISFEMKDLEWNILGYQERYYTPKIINWKKLKSKTRAGTKVWYFYTSLDFSKPIVVTEGEIDWLTISELPNTIWIQGIHWLKSLIEKLRDKGVSNIYLLVDKDHIADIAIWKLLDMDEIFLKNIFDSRWILWDNKDINEYICSWWDLRLEYIYDNWKSLWEFKALIKSFLLPWNKPKINHNKFAKYLIKKFNIASTKENLFIYDYWYNKWIWKPFDKQEAKNLIITELEYLLSHTISNFRVADITNTLEFIISHSKSTELEEWLIITNDSEINLSDWILDTKTMKIREYTAEDYKFQKLPYLSKVFDTSKRPEKFIWFLKEILEWFEDVDGVVSFLQEYLWWLFVSDTKYERSLMLYWSGANWKWVLLNIINEMLGKTNCSNIGLHEINNDQYLYNLIGKLVNIDSDMQQNVQLDSWIIKKLISGEVLSAKGLYKQPIEFKSFVRLLLATNELPYLKTIDNSIKRRFVFIHLKQSFYGRENPNLKKELLEERDSIFVWVVEGLKRLLDRDWFDIPKELEGELLKFIKENDTIELFLDEWIVEKHEKEKIYNKDLYILYRIFCNESWYKPLSKRKFNSRLIDKGFEKFRDSYGRGFLWLRQNKPLND